MNYIFTFCYLLALLPLAVQSQTTTLFSINEQQQSVVQCEGFVLDDKGRDIPYTDEGTAKTNVVTICPDQPSQNVVKITFTRFDVAPGDQLLAYDGMNVNAPLFTTNATTGSGSGVSVSDAPGGSIVEATCENNSGCITLAFNTNGDNIKGAGFVGVVSCEPRVGTALDCSRIDQFNGGAGKFFTAADCATGKSSVQIPIPSYMRCNLIGELDIISSCVTSLPSTITGTGLGFVEADFPIGQHTVVFQAKEYPELRCEATIQVLAPNMVCNNDVNVSLFNDCIVAITPDLILENECEPATVIRPSDGVAVPTFSYNIQLIDNDFADVIGYTINGYPIVDFGAAECGTTLDIRIIKSYLNDSDCDGELFDGTEADDFPVVNLCWGSIRIEDKIPPTIINGPRQLAIPCYEQSYDATQLLEQLNHLDPNLMGEGGTIKLELTDANIFVGGADQLEVIENCYYETSAGSWEFITGDCANSETITDWNGITYDASIFGYYRRIYTVADKCQNEATFEQRVLIYQPDLVAPVPEINVPCGTDIDPRSIYMDWIEWIEEGRPNDERKNYASYLPNFDPTPIDFPNYTITNQSGDEVPLDVISSDCGYAMDWVDSDTIYACGGSYQIFRTWTMYDWCDGQLRYVGLPPQVITVGDQVAPTILEHLSYQISGSSNLGCTVNVRFQKPAVEDDCSGDITIRLSIGGIEKTFETETLVFEGIAIDEATTITLTAQDACGNETTETITEVFPDIVAPVAICESNQAISMGLSCNVSIPALSFDDGSFDNCGSLTYLVSKLNEDGSIPADSLFTPIITFSSDDLQQTCDAKVGIALKVIDGTGNENICISEVELQDKLAPTASSVTDTIACSNEQLSDLLAISRNLNPITRLDDLEEWIAQQPTIGNFNAQDNCTATDDLTLHITTANFTQLDPTCKSGFLTYNYRLVDQCGNGSLIYTGSLHIEPTSDWRMTFPTDKVIYCDSTSALSINPVGISEILTDNGCDSWGLEVQPQQFEESEGACYKIINNYKFINWCTWNPNNTEIAVVERPDSLLSENFKVSLRYLDENKDGINDIDDGDENNNEVYIYDEEGPFKIEDVEEAVDFDIYDNTPLTFDGDFVIIDANDAVDVTTYDAVSQFTNNLSTYVSAQAYGNFVYRQIIKVIDNTAPNITILPYDAFCGGEAAAISGAACTAPVTIDFSVTDFCASIEEITVSYLLNTFGETNEDTFGKLESLGNGQFQITGNYPLSEDGSSVTHTFIIRAEDGCGNIQVAGVPFEVKDCKAPVIVCNTALSTTMPAEGELTLDADYFNGEAFDFCSPTESILFTFADPTLYQDSISRTFRCSQDEVGAVPITLWAMDKAGNVSTCETFINISPFANNSCSGDNVANITGIINTEDDRPVENVEVNLSGNNSSMEMTNVNGSFMFPNMLLGSDYTVKPVKDTNPLNGVSTFDLLLLNKHILDVERLDSPYKLIAADVNKSGTITTFDMILIRRVILNYDQNFKENTSWRFIPSNYEFPDPSNPWLEVFPEEVSINDFEFAQSSTNFIAIKVGDVNGNSIPNDAATIESRIGQDAVSLNGTVKKVDESTVKVHLSLDQIEAIEGFQFELQYGDHLELQAIQSTVLAENNWKEDDHRIGFSWIKTNSQASKDIVELTFRTYDAALDWKEALQLSSIRLRAEAYKENGIASIALDLSTVSSSHKVLQGQPNPFSVYTTIPIYLSENDVVKWQIQNISGQVILQNQRAYQAGNQSLIIDRQQLPSAGIYFCTIMIGELKSTQKIVLVE